MKKILLLCMLSFVAIMASAQLTYDFNKETGVLTIGGNGTIVTQEDVNKAIGRDSYQDNSTLKEVAFTATDVTTIGYYAFSDCSALTSITLPDAVTTIGYYAFSNCSALTSITLPDAVTTIGDYAFSDCSALTSITLPDAVTTIGDGAFSGCKSLTDITVSSQNAYFRSVGGVLFDKQKKVLHTYPAGRKETSYIVPESTETIGGYAFSDCSALTSITLPDAVTTIGDGAFSGCSALTSIIIPDGVTTIGDNAFYRCSSLTSITLPDAVTTIGRSVFLKCRSLTSIIIPDGVTTIGDNAFMICSSLTNIILPDELTTIGDYAFCDCGSLTNITLPDALTTIGDNAFEYCNSLTDITCLSETEPTINDDAFGRAPRNRTVYVPNATSGFTAANWGKSDYNAVTIKYGEYPTGIEESVDTSSFTTQIANGTLFIQGLKPGTAYTVTDTNGSLIAKGIATQNNCQVNLTGHGICIISIAGASKKVVY